MIHRVINKKNENVFMSFVKFRTLLTQQTKIWLVDWMIYRKDYFSSVSTTFAASCYPEDSNERESLNSANQLFVVQTAAEFSQGQPKLLKTFEGIC